MIKKYLFIALKFILAWAGVVAVIIVSTLIIKAGVKLILFSWNLWH